MNWPAVHFAALIAYCVTVVALVPSRWGIVGVVLSCFLAICLWVLGECLARRLFAKPTLLDDDLRARMLHTAVSQYKANKHAEQQVRTVLQVGARKEGVPSRQEVYEALKQRSIELQSRSE